MRPSHVGSGAVEDVLRRPLSPPCAATRDETRIQAMTTTTTAHPTPIDLLTIDEAAKALRISRRTLQQMLADGTVKAARFGRAVRIPADELRRVVRESQS